MSGPSRLARWSPWWRRGGRAWGALAWGGVLASCAGTGASRPAEAPVKLRDDAADARAFAAAEDRALSALAATDPRFALRLATGGTATGRDDAERRAAVDALLAEDTNAIVHDGALDFFSFAARARGLDAAAAIVRSLPSSTSDAKGSRERKLLARAVDEERARLDEERDLPRSASELVRGMVETWAAPASLEAVDVRDGWASRRLDGVSDVLHDGALPAVELIELDDALDPLERDASPSEYPATAGAIARLRVALSRVRPTATRDASWPRVARALAAHLGVSAAPDAIGARLETARVALRAALATGMARRAQKDDRALLRDAEALLFAPGHCAARASESAVRALAPPVERAAICGVLQSIANADTDEARLATLVALDLEVTTASWAFAIHARGIDPDRAEERVRPVLALPPEREVRLLRLAVARPVVALGAALAAEILVRHAPAASLGAGIDSPSLGAPARLWLAFGDAPLDAVEDAAFRGDPPGE